MIRELQKYIDTTVEIIYMDRNGNFTQRKIQIRSVAEPFVKAICLEQRAPRLFRIERILAVRPLGRYAV